MNAESFKKLLIAQSNNSHNWQFIYGSENAKVKSEKVKVLTL